MQIKYSLDNPGQKAFAQDETTKLLMLCGGLGSGKSFALMMKMLRLSAINQDMAGGLLCPSLPEFKKDMLPLFLETLDRFVPGYRYHKTDKYFLFPWSNAPLYVFTAENDIKGPNLAYAGVNEFSSIKLQQIQQIIQRVRLKKAVCPQIAFVGTPEDEYLWLEEFIDKQTKKKNLRLIECTTMDNKHNNADYVEILRDTLDEQQFKLFVLGQRIRLTKDSFYYAYDTKLNDYECEEDEDALIYANLDFNVGNMTTTLAQIIGKGINKQILFFKEIVLTDFGSDTEAMGNAIKKLYHPSRLLLTVDASAKSRKTSGMSDVKILENQGFKVRYKSVNPRMRKRQIMVNGLLSKRNILINPKTCPILKRDLLRVEQDKVTFEKMKDKPELTHASDTLDYLCDFEFEDWLDKAHRDRFKTVPR